MTEKYLNRLSAAWKLTRQVSGDAVSSAAKFVSSQQRNIASGTQGALDGAGRVSESAGLGLELRCQNLIRELRTARVGKPREGLEEFLDRATDLSLGLGSLIGRSLGSAGKGTRKASPAIGAATGGAIAGTMCAVSGAVDAVAIQQSDIDALESRRTRAGEAARLLSQRELGRIEAARRSNQRTELLDMLVVGGVSLSSVLSFPEAVPGEIEQAFQLAYPKSRNFGRNIRRRCCASAY